ncbi:MAG: hypothetical protein AB7P49_03680 [Bdellovibrionales bacterium]
MEDPNTVGIPVIYIACLTPDTIGNFQLNCDAFNCDVASDVDQRQSLIDGVTTIRREVACSFCPNSITTATKGKLEAMAYDFQRQGRWRFLVVVETPDCDDFGTAEDVERRLKDILLLLWKNQDLYKHQEDRKGLEAFIRRLSMRPCAMRIADDVRTGPPVLLGRTNHVRFKEYDEEETSGLLFAQEEAADGDRAFLIFWLCFLVFWVVWFCCLCLCVCASLASVILFSVLT